AYPLWFQFLGPQSYHARIPFADWGEDVTGFVTFSRYSLANFAVIAESPIAAREQNAWFGWPLFLVAVISAVLLWRQGHRLARAVSLTGVLFGFLSLGPTIRINGHTLHHVPGPWRIVGANTPILRLVLPSRLAIVVTGVVVILVALLCDALLAN